MHNLAFYVSVRRETREALRRQGYGPFKIRRILEDATDDVIDLAVEESGVSPPAGGPLLDAILAFLRNDEGKKIIDALLKILLSFV